MPETANEQASLGQLFSDLSEHLQSLVVYQFRLAHLETVENLKRLVQESIWLVLGGVLGVSGLLVLLAAVLLGLASVVPPWQAASMLGLLLVLAGLLLVLFGRRRLVRVSVIPRETIATLKEVPE
jgi:putative superfamily III holin-X